MKGLVSNMTDKKPQSFCEVLSEADHGRIDTIFSGDFAALIDHLTTKASLHEDTWKGEMTITIKVAAEPNGKIELTFARKVKQQEEKLPKARMIHDPEEGTVTNGTQIKIRGTLDDRPVKSAAAPK